MSTTEGLQQQQPWPDLDVSYFRWEPPVFPGGQSDAQEKQQPKSEGRKGRVESAFAHSSFPTSFTGWDKVRAASEKAATLAGHHSSDHLSQAHISNSQSFPAAASEPVPERFSVPASVTGYPAPGAAMFGAQGNRSPFGPGPSSAFTSLRGGDKLRAAPMNPSVRNFSWPTQSQAPSQQQPTQQYGASFDGVFGAKQPAGARFGIPDEAEFARAGGAAATASIGQNSLPILLVQCGKFAAPVQREAQQTAASQHNHFSNWADQSEGSQDAFHSSWQARKVGAGTLRSPPGSEPLQLQEYYTAQSDMFEELLRGNGVRDPNLLAAAVQGNLNGQEMDHDFLDMLGSAPLGRAASVLDVPRVPPSGDALEPEPYMPQWQSESVPAELPNHVVNRLLMGGNGISTRHQRGLSGTKRDWMQSIPDGEELIHQSISGAHGSGGEPRQNRLSEPESPKVDELEELARTADVEIAHRAFLVPPHKKRGKGGRQPAADPRLDPNIDARRAKRILANRLSAARSKMKQKNQMDCLSAMVKQLEEHSKQLKEDAAELMEACEETEFENRRLSQQAKVLEEFGRRQMAQNSCLLHRRAGLTSDAASRQNSVQEEIPPPTVRRLSGDESGRGIQERLPSKNSTENLMQDLGSGMSPGDALLEYARET